MTRLRDRWDGFMATKRISGALQLRTFEDQPDDRARR